MDHELVLLLKVYENGLAAHVHNFGLDPAAGCQVILERLDRYVEHRGDFTRGHFKRCRVLICSAPAADVSEGHVFFSYLAQDKMEISGLTEGTWRAEFSVEIDGQQTNKEVRFLRWKPGSAIELVDDPRLEREATDRTLGDNPGDAISTFHAIAERRQLEKTALQTDAATTREVKSVRAQPRAVPQNAEAADRSALVDAFLLRCNEEPTLPVKIIKTHVWRAAGHQKARQFGYWQAADAKATASDNRNFSRILAMTPAEFVALLKKKELV